MADVPPVAQHRSLYRRFRPRRFGEVRAQEHVTRTLRNAVRDDRVGHAYLFSGPRGTGKTSTARILAAALNCAALDDGEPCGACPSCLAVAQGTSLDVHELDAASHNGVDAMRDLVARAALGTPGRHKVYIVDEVHMLSTAASNALLKILEEPPAHVVFVLATTDPQKVLPTIRSRTQHFEFRLLGGEALSALLVAVNEAAGLGVTREALDLVARRGKGSARDALSVLDQVAAAGQVDDDAPDTDAAVEALCERDAGALLVAVAGACAAGRDARRLAADLVEHLRTAFLATLAPALADVPDAARVRLEEQARRLGGAVLVRAIEVLGQAQVDMRDALDPRITLEAALVRLARPDADPSPAAMLERIERLERTLAAAPARPAPAPVPPRASAPAAPRRLDGPPRPRPEAPPLPGRGGPPASGPGPAPVPAPAPPPPPAPAASLPSRDQLTKAWGDVVLGSLGGRAKARFGAGRFVAVDDAAVFAVPNEHYLGRCQEVRAEVEAALSAHFGRPVPLRLVIDRQDPAEAWAGGPGPGGDGGGAAVHDDEDPADLDGSHDAAAAVTSPEERLKQAFPGAEEVSP